MICGHTFYYSCADLEVIDLSEIELLYYMYRSYSDYGVLAWISKKRGGLLPHDEWLSDTYFEAVEYLKDKDIKIENIKMDNME